MNWGSLRRVLFLAMESARIGERGEMRGVELWERDM